ncbi:MAG: transposase [Campylobacteraceae bacterium]|nr:transposase [Campylobacteraceae bacterium]
MYSKLKKLYKKDLNKLIFVYEPTGSYSFLTKKFCALKSIKSFIINPKQSSNFEKALEQRSKSDRIDDLMLSRAITIARENETRETIKEIIESDKKLSTTYKNIQTIPGIGKIAGIVLMHLFISYPNANKNQIVSLTGLDPIIKESGTSLKTKARISNMVVIKFN